MRKIATGAPLSPEEVATLSALQDLLNAQIRPLEYELSYVTHALRQEWTRQIFREFEKPTDVGVPTTKKAET
jgi:hypothetical protein